MAAANIPIESLVDSPLDEKHYTNQLFEDRSGKSEEFTGAFVIYGLNHEKKTNKQQSVSDYVCDAIWDMGFDAKPDFFSSVTRLSGMKNAPLVCELKNMHMKLGNEILESLEDVKRIHPDLLLPNKQVVISKFLPPPPKFMINFSKKINRSTVNAKSMVIEAGNFLGIEIPEESISFAEVALERYNCVICQFSDINLAKKLYNFRDAIQLVSKCPIYNISFYREHKDFYYDKMLLISGLNTKRKDCTKLFFDVCQDLGVDLAENDVSRCDWLYSKAFKSRAQRSPLVVEFNSEEKRVAVFQASVNESKIQNEHRLGTKPRKPRLPKKETGDEEQEAVELEDVVVKEETSADANGEEPAALVYRKVYINPFISLPASMLYSAARDMARKKRNLVCLPMSFYGRITLQIKEKEEAPVVKEDVEDPENKASAVDDLTEVLKEMSLDGKDLLITSPYDLWKIDRKFRSAALDKYFMYTDPFYMDVGYMLEPYEWFSTVRKSEKRLSRRQLERLHPY